MEHPADNRLEARGDRFVVETDIEDPVDHRLLWDAVRSTIRQQVGVCDLLGRSGWRPSETWKKDLKTAWQRTSRTRNTYRDFKQRVREYLQLVDRLRQKLSLIHDKLTCAHAGELLEQYNEYMAYAERLRD